MDTEETNVGSEPASERVVEGTLELAGGDGISGWAWDSSRPDSPVRVDIFADGTLAVVGVLANQARSDLVEAGKGNGRHGFSTEPPSEWFDGQVRVITVRIWGDLIELDGSPQSVAFVK